MKSYNNNNWTFFVFKLNDIIIFVNKQFKRIIKKHLKKDIWFLLYINSKYNLELI